MPPQAPPQPQPRPQSYQNIDQELPFQQEMVYPGGRNRVPYAAGGQARTEYTGSWPPPPPQAYTPAPEPRQPYSPPQRETVPPAFAQAEYYVPRQNYQPSAQYAQPHVYATPPRQTWAPENQEHKPQAPEQTTVPRHPRKNEDKTAQPGLGVRLMAVAGALLPKKSKAESKPSRPAAQPQHSRSQPQSGGPVPGYNAPQRSAPPQPVRPAISSVEMKYYIWSGSIVAGLLLTVVSFIYACAA